LIEAGNYSLAYALLLYDIKPLLTGRKTNEHEVPWTNCTFVIPLVTGAVLQEQFRLWANDLLQDLEDAELIVVGIGCSAAPPKPAPTSTVEHVALAGCGSALLALLGIAIWVVQKRVETILANVARGIPHSLHFFMRM
jgi:hypothetical protein